MLWRGAGLPPGGEGGAGPVHPECFPGRDGWFTENENLLLNAENLE